MKTSPRILLPLALLAGCVLALSSMSLQAADKVIKIGALLPISGPGSYFGVQDKQGVELALDQLNKRGVSGYKFDVHYEDSACSPLPATQAAKRLLDQYQPDVVIGEECSDATLAVMPLMDQAKIPLLNAGSSSIKITDPGNPYTFRIMPNEVMQGVDLAINAYKRLDAKTAVLLHENTNAGIGNAKVFAETFEKLGGKILEDIGFGRDVNDFTAIATRIAGLGNIDVIPTYTLEGQGLKITEALTQAGIVKVVAVKPSNWAPFGCRLALSKKLAKQRLAIFGLFSSIQPSSARSCAISSRTSKQSSIPTLRTLMPTPMIRLC